MDTKFIVTREYRELRPGDFFAFCARSPFIRRFDSYDGNIFRFTIIRSYNKDVIVSDYYSASFHPRALICIPR